LVRAIGDINRKYRDDEDGWNEKQSLKYWTEVCKSGTLDFDVLEFVRQEVRLRYQDRPDLIGQWQETCCKLIEYLLREGLPMEEFGGLSFYQMNNRAIQSEIMLLASLSACAICTEKLSTISWVDDCIFGTWLARMQGQRAYSDLSIVVFCLSWLNLDGTNLVAANLDGTNLNHANLGGANLNGACLNRTSLVGANLVGARLNRTSLVGANLVGARLNGANLFRANLDGANLNGANLNGARLNRTSMDLARLKQIYWDEDTKWKDVQGLESAQNVPEELKQQLGLP
jgi:uncharacterized protein YjbI with pentapeptide repeats